MEFFLRFFVGLSGAFTRLLAQLKWRLPHRRAFSYQILQTKIYFDWILARMALH